MMFVRALASGRLLHAQIPEIKALLLVGRQHPSLVGPGEYRYKGPLGPLGAVDFRK